MWLPDADWIKFSELMVKNYPDILCSQSENVCYFQSTCSNITYNDNEFKIEVGDEIGTFTLKVNESEFFVAGELVSSDSRANELCYVPVFMSKLGYNDLW